MYYVIWNCVTPKVLLFYDFFGFTQLKFSLTSKEFNLTLMSFILAIYISFSPFGYIISFAWLDAIIL
jgi:hypothetical protein